MGLDVYFYRVVKPEDQESDPEAEPFYIDEGDCDNLYYQVLLKKFKSHITTARRDYYDWKGTFKKLGMPENSVWMGCSTTCNEEMVHEFHVNGATRKIKESSVDFVTKDVKCLYVVEIGYQRKSVKNSFYGSVVSTENEDEDMVVVSDQVDFDIVKQYCEPSSPMESWNLSDDTFLYFSY